MIRPLPARLLADLDAGPGALVAFGAGPDRALYALHALKPLEYRTTRPGPSYPKINPAQPQDYRARAWLDGRCVLDLRIVGERYNVHALQPLGDDLLLACARSGGSAGRANGRVYSRDGRRLREFALGDGIGHLQTTARGAIWTGYFDEGVFGDDPVSACGLAAWDAHGANTFQFQPQDGLDTICDCYALNVADERQTWLYYYTEFALVLLRERRIAGQWRPPFDGACAVAVQRRHALMYRNPRRGREAALFRLDGDGRCSELARFELQREDGAPLRPERVDGRGDTLYAYADGCAWAVDVEQALAAAL
ncbi:hypothetical protein SAMN04487939_11277 [Lysobacter sp. yr284]|uniref:hypothetical protein n=1 Tax=Lysobacter sp. yr284 TaxID=1761791 RepID=UPI00089881BB|nr:hypothetical protein [Lysobacter sp. yr284]SDZ02423.1 hypothetical protein SAMN04487939_11277 [Lysobacter sp. yr284]